MSDPTAACLLSQQAAAPWSATLSRHKRASHWKSIWQLANSLLPFFALWYLMLRASTWSYWLTLLLAVPTAGFLIRIFIIQHDCGHHSFFRSRRANDILGQLCGLLTLTPYYLWRRTHSRHHASSGDLDHRGHGDVDVLTVEEYRQRSTWGRLKYRLYRNPILMFVFGASFLFVLRQRFTLGVPAAWRRERRGVHLTNLGLAAGLLAGWYAIGLTPFLMVHLPIVIIGATIGSWLFFVQHQFEDAYWQPHPSWDYHRAALAGSSYYRLPRVLQWFTGNIGFHHIHHLESRIPNYNLNACYDENPALRDAVTFGIRDSLRCTRFKLWDEGRGRMVTFAEAATTVPSP
jgi:omega-6 fatty acid desaturase (delta-12 desaturase)